VKKWAIKGRWSNHRLTENIRSAQLQKGIYFTVHCDQGGGLVAQKVLNTITLILALLLSLLLIASLIQLIVGGDIIQTFTKMTLSVINVVLAVTIIFIIIVLVLENSSPVHTLAWIMVLIFLPIVGFIF